MGGTTLELRATPIPWRTGRGFGRTGDLKCFLDASRPSPSMKAVRIEKDSMGAREVPADAYWGIQTLRARENFPVSGLRASPYLLRSYAYLKLACVRANLERKGIDPTKGHAIAQAAEEMAQGRFDAEFPV